MNLDPESATFLHAAARLVLAHPGVLVIATKGGIKSPDVYAIDANGMLSAERADALLKRIYIEYLAIM